MIKVYDADKLLADVELIDGKLHVIDYDEGDTSQFILEDLRRPSILAKCRQESSEHGDQKIPTSIRVGTGLRPRAIQLVS